MRPALVLLLLSLVAFAPQVLFSEWRGTEALRIEIAREMYQSADWMVPTFGREPTLSKPPLHYWILAALQAFGRGAAPMRLPSVLAFWLLALICHNALQRHFGKRAAWIGAAAILLSPMALDHAPYAEIDPLFAALTAISIVWLAEGVSFRSRWHLVAAGAIGGLALLTKGPPYLLFVAGSALVWFRRRRLEGAPWFCLSLLSVPLAYYVPLLMIRVPLAEMWTVAGNESVGRINFFTLGHVVETPWYFVRAAIALLPMGLWAFHEYGGEREMRDTTPEERGATFLRICGGAMWGAVVLLAFFPARPGRYLLPGVPCFLIAVAPAVAAWTRSTAVPTRALGMIRFLGVAGSLGLIAAPWIPFPYDRATPWLLLAVAVAPWSVRGRLGMVVYVLVIPLIAAWTLLPDRERRRAVAPRSEMGAAEMVQHELLVLGAEGVRTWGQIPSQLLLAGETIMRGDDLPAEPPTSPWVIVVDVGFDRDGTFARYVDRVRLCLSDETLVIKQRRE